VGDRNIELNILFEIKV